MKFSENPLLGQMLNETAEVVSGELWIVHLVLIKHKDLTEQVNG
jgi:hypothetical protein